MKTKLQRKFCISQRAAEALEKLVTALVTSLCDTFFFWWQKLLHIWSDRFPPVLFFFVCCRCCTLNRWEVNRLHKHKCLCRIRFYFIFCLINTRISMLDSVWAEKRREKTAQSTIVIRSMHRLAIKLRSFAIRLKKKWKEKSAHLRFESSFLSFYLLLDWRHVRCFISPPPTVCLLVWWCNRLLFCSWTDRANVGPVPTAVDLQPIPPLLAPPWWMTMEKIATRWTSAPLLWFLCASPAVPIPPDGKVKK